MWTINNNKTFNLIFIHIFFRSTFHQEDKNLEFLNGLHVFYTTFTKILQIKWDKIEKKKKKLVKKTWRWQYFDVWCQLELRKWLKILTDTCILRWNKNGLMISNIQHTTVRKRQSIDGLKLIAHRHVLQDQSTAIWFHIKE